MKKILLAFVAVVALTSVKASYLYWTVTQDQLTQAGGDNVYARIAVYENDPPTATGNYLTYADDSTGSTVVQAQAGQSYRFDLDTYGTAKYSYVVELGNYTAPDNFTANYVSAAQKYSDSASVIDIALTDPELSVLTTHWSGVSYAAPEPTGAMLMLVGMALLGLKRRKA